MQQPKATGDWTKNWTSFVQVLLTVISICGGISFGYGLKTARIDHLEKAAEACDKRIELIQWDWKKCQEKDQGNKEAVQKALAELTTGQAVLNAKMDMLLKRFDEKRLDKVAAGSRIGAITNPCVGGQP